MAKPFYLSKTVVVNVLLAVVAFLSLMVGPDFPIPIPGELVQYIVLAIALVNVVLRFLTGQPLKVK